MLTSETYASRRKWLPILLTAGFAFAAGFALLLASATPAVAAVEGAIISVASTAVVALFLSWQLRSSNARARSALETMSTGVCMFDPQERLVVVNRKYIKMYALSDEVVKPGVTFRQVLAHRRATGQFTNDIDDYRNQLLSAIRQGRMTTAEVRSADGRLVLVRNRPMPEGGWVGTHEDITDRRQAETERDAMQQFGERRATIDSAIANFRGRVEQHLRVVADSTEAMRTTATGLLSSSGQTQERAESAVTASNEASVNVEGAAAAAEELNGSIIGIGQQIGRATEVVGKAVAETRSTNEQISSLAQAAQKIGDVIKLIRNIAGQTNLLALNATIEAARAGEAGKGFAVVASEVKSLATQTAKATEEISTQISAIQSSTHGAAQAIERVRHTITEISDIAASVATSVGQQGAATQDITENVTRAGVGAREAAANIGGVREAAGETGHLANDVLRASRELTQQADSLHQEMDRFLTTVRAG